MHTCRYLAAILLVGLLACRGEPDAAPPAVNAVAPAGEPAPPPAAPVAVAAASEDAASPAEPLEEVAASAPAGLVARAISPSQIALSWQPPADSAVAQYEVARGGAPIALSTAVAAVDTSVRPGRRYCYSVVALDVAGNRSPPSRTACAALPDVVAPAAPGGVAATASSDKSVAIAWIAAADDGDVASYEVFRGDARVAATPSLRASDAGLQPAMKYCYAVEAIDRAGNRSPRSAPACATTPDTKPPSPPENVVTRAWGEHEIAVGWSPANDDVGVVAYEVLSGGKVVAKTADTHFAVRGLAPWTEHCYEVRALDAAGNGSAPAKPSCARTHDLTAPSVPAATAEPVSDREIAIRWSASADNVRVVGYEVERNEKDVARGEGLVAHEKGLEPARKYCYFVRAMDPAGNVSAWAKVCATTPDLTPPTQPARLAMAPRAGTEAISAWEASTDDVGVVSYEIVRGEEVFASVSKAGTLLSGLAPETKYCFAVRARDAAGNRSPPAGPICLTTPDLATPPAPLDLRVHASADGVRLRWEPSPQAGVVYAVYVDENRRVGMTSTSAFQVKGSLFSKKRCFRVAAVDDAGRESPKTFPACASDGAATARAE
jgi:chitodextrinase